VDTILTIKQVAQQTGLSIDTLRYYERIGLLEPIGRAQSGHRRYTEHDLAWIDLIMRLRETGMPLAEIARFAQLRRQGVATLTDRRLMLEQHQRALEAHMRDLTQHLAALQSKIARLKSREAQQDMRAHPASISGESSSGESSSGEAAQSIKDPEARAR
jgi:DNA-binding transcriptional MerR regulator